MHLFGFKSADELSVENLKETEEKVPRYLSAVDDPQDVRSVGWIKAQRHISQNTGKLNKN